jgi:hypothetical protein
VNETNFVCLVQQALRESGNVVGMPPAGVEKGCQAGPKISLLAEVVPLSPGTENLTSIEKGPTLTSTPPVQSAEVLGTIVPIL